MISQLYVIVLTDGHSFYFIYQHKNDSDKEAKTKKAIVHQLIATVKFSLDVKINCLCTSNFFRMVLHKTDNTLDPW